MRLTAKERILLHLQEVPATAEALEVPPALAQEGVARGAGVELRHLAQFIRPLIQEGLVQQRTAHVKGGRQRRKVYELTDEGRRSAIRLRERVRSAWVRVRDGSSVREVRVAELLETSGQRLSVLDIVRRTEATGVVEIGASSRPQVHGFVEQIADAPKPETFVGRREELADLLERRSAARIFMVTGVPGIGKSSFGAKACELARGRMNLFWHRVRPWDSLQVVLADMGRFLSALGRPGLASVLSRGEVARALEVLRQDLPGTNSFLVFDDAHEASTDVLSAFRMLREAVAGAPDVLVLFLSRRSVPFYDRRAVALESLVREVELMGLGSDEAAAFLGDGTEIAAFAGLGRRLAGHPLFLELVRSHRPRPTEGIRDVSRFIEEVVYRQLSDAQRIIMKVGSLYRVPVPESTLLAGPGSSYDALVSLLDQSLIRRVGDDRYEIHDTIRDFFAGTLSPDERRIFDAIAVSELRGLAARASAANDIVGCVAFLSNALQLAGSNPDRGDLFESLGDANESLGDLLAVSTAYREAMAMAPDATTLARRHRKLASALIARGRLELATVELDEAAAALGSAETAERGWIDLGRAMVSIEDYDWSTGERYAEAALTSFERHGDPAGEARALLAAGRAATWTGSTDANGAPLATLRFERALRLARTLKDPVLEAWVHVALAIAIGYGTGDYEAGMAHWRAVESSPAAMADPYISAMMHLERAWFLLRTREDISAARADVTEAARVARQIHHARVLADAKYQTATMFALEGRNHEAATLFEEAGVAMAEAGIMGFAASALWGATWHFLASGDWDGYRRLVASLREPELDRALSKNRAQWLAHHGLTRLAEGDVAGFERCFAEALRLFEETPSLSLHFQVNTWKGLFAYSIGLRALGRTGEAEEQRRRALESVRAAGNRQATRQLESDLGERAAQTLRERMKRA